MTEQNQPLNSTPIIFEMELDDDNSYYGGSGSGFFISIDNTIFWLTAYHNIKDHMANDEDIRVFPEGGESTSIPFNARYVVKINENEEERDGNNDIYCIRVDTSLFEKTNPEAVIYHHNIRENTIFEGELKKNEKVIIAGYPFELQKIDNIESTLAYQPVIAHGLLLGDSFDSHCFSVKINPKHGINDFDGFSGSPVYSVRDNSECFFIGMVINGNAYTNIIHVINSDYIANFIDKANQEGKNGG